METSYVTTSQPQDDKKHLATYGMYLDRKSASVAVNSLKKMGIAEDQISLLAPNRHGRRDFVYQQSTSVKEGAIMGATIGFFILGFVGFLIGLNITADTQANYYTESAFPFWIVTSIVGVVLGLILGAVCGALVGIGTPRTAAKRYGFYLKEGGIMLTVTLENESDRSRVNRILEQTGAQDINILDESQTWTAVVPEKRKLIYT